MHVVCAPVFVYSDDMENKLNTKDVIAATIHGKLVKVYVHPDGTRMLRPPYGGGGYVTENQWHLLTDTDFHYKS